MPPKSAVALAKAGKANRSKITDFFSVPGSVPGPSTTFLDQAPDHKSPAKRQRGVSEDESETLDDRPAKSKRPALAVKADKTSNVQAATQLGYTPTTTTFIYDAYEAAPAINDLHGLPWG